MRRGVAVRPFAAFLPYAVVGAVHLVAKLVDNSALDQFTKPLLMPLLLVGFLFALPRRRSEIALLGSLAIAFSWLGDVALLYPGDLGFLTGLGFFLLAHVAYLLLILRKLRMRRLGPFALIYAAWWVALVALLAPHLGSLLIPVALYGLVLGAVAAFGTTGSGTLIAGTALFLVSDTLLGVNRFLPGFELWHVDFIIMLTYIVGQGLIAYAAVRAASNQEKRLP
jgi:uncharacterized membrane protein YhhN